MYAHAKSPGSGKLWHNTLMTTQPNLLFIMPDQLRADFLSCYGAAFIDTPHIDSIAQGGIRYERAYSISPICVPARASLLTGMNAIRNGVTDNGQWLRPDLAQCGIHTWPEILANAGYYTAAVGKMHFYPWDIKHGFQYRVACEDKRWIYVRDDYYHELAAHGQRKYHGNEHEGYYENRGAITNKMPRALTWDGFVGREACRFLRTYGQEQPFAMMVGFPGPHCPYDPTSEYLAQFDPADMPAPIPCIPGDAPKLRQSNIDGNRGAWNGVDYTEFTEAHKRKIRAHYAGLVKQIDDEVGEILDTLREQKLLDNTIIIFASDHGDYLGDHDLIGKGSFYEASIHVPLLVRVPERFTGHIPSAKTYGSLVQLGDVTATLLALAGCALPTYMDAIPLPGLNLPGSRQRSQVIGMTSGGWMIDDGEWRLAKYSTGEQLLFHRATDPNEQHNLLADPAYSDQLRRLDGELTQQLLQFTTDSHATARVYSGNSLWSDPSYGKEGWQRPYPQTV